MTDRLYHRGPDGGGYFHAPWVALGHRRLAIIDRAGGEQPMANEDQSAWIVFNGEIYNHRELRRDLETRGHRFRTQSDTEAIVHAYEEWGDACVERLDGMFAFAIADTRVRRVLLARDRLGKKPLFHAMFNGVLHFASEIKAIKASPFWNGRVNLDSVEGYLSLGYYVAPATAYHHVHKLEPAHTLSIEGSRIIDRKYWDITAFDTDERADPRAGRRGRRAARRGGVATARERGADRRVPVRRHRLRADRVVHGGGARQPAGHRIGRLRSFGAQRARARRPDRGAFRDAPPHRDHRAQARGRARSDRPLVRRAVRRSVGDPDLLRQQDGAPARHGGAVGRRRRRSLRRLRVALPAARARGAGPQVHAGHGRPRRRLVARRALAARARVPAAAASRQRARESRSRSGRARTTPTCVSSSRRTRARCSASRRHANRRRARSTTRSRGRIASAAPTARCSARCTPISRSTCRTIRS